MVVAFAIIRQCVPLNRAMDNLIYYICSSVIDKFILIDPGLLFKLTKGLPSGHPFTSIINTVCNWVLWTTIFYNYCQRTDTDCDHRFRIICSGDDTIIKVPRNIDLNILTQCINESGMTTDEISNTLGMFYTIDGTQGVTFLRRRFLPDGLLC
jgi:hypothetical protein